MFTPAKDVMFLSMPMM